MKLCKCNDCDIVLEDTNSQIGAKDWPDYYVPILTTTHRCPICLKHTTLSDDIVESDVANLPAMRLGKRTKMDFKNHILTITEVKDFGVIHHLHKPNTVTDSLKFINVGGVMSVTGDYGNWIFCREFIPNAKSSTVSDSYMAEKLANSSCQEFKDFDSAATIEQLKERIKEYEENCKDQEKEPNEDVLEYYETCIDKASEHKLDYTAYAYREMPKCIDYEDVVFLEDYKYWLKMVFDAFEEICLKLKDRENLTK